MTLRVFFRSFNQSRRLLGCWNRGHRIRPGVAFGLARPLIATPLGAAIATAMFVLAAVLVLLLLLRLSFLLLALVALRFGQNPQIVFGVLLKIFHRDAVV